MSPQIPPSPCAGRKRASEASEKACEFEASKVPRRGELLVYEEAEEDDNPELPRVVGLEVLLGRYEPSGQNDGRDVYRKVEGAGPRPVFLYYAKSQNDDEVAGWWFSDEVGGSKAWCFAEGSSFPPPASGWVVPTDDAIPVQSLRVGSSPHASLSPKASPSKPAMPTSVRPESDELPRRVGSTASGPPPGTSSRLPTPPPRRHQGSDEPLPRAEQLRPSVTWPVSRASETAEKVDKTTAMRNKLLGQWYGRDPRGLRQWHRIEQVSPTLLKCFTETEGRIDNRCTRINLNGGQVLWGKGEVHLDTWAMTDEYLVWISSRGTRWEWRRGWGGGTKR